MTGNIASMFLQFLFFWRNNCFTWHGSQNTNNSIPIWILIWTLVVLGYVSLGSWGGTKIPDSYGTAVDEANICFHCCLFGRFFCFCAHLFDHFFHCCFLLWIKKMFPCLFCCGSVQYEEWMTCSYLKLIQIIMSGSGKNVKSSDSGSVKSSNNVNGSGTNNCLFNKWCPWRWSWSCWSYHFHISNWRIISGLSHSFRNSFIAILL